MTTLATLYLNEFASLNDFPFDLGSPNGIDYLRRVRTAVAAELSRLGGDGISLADAITFFEANADDLIEVASGVPFPRS